MAPGEGSGDGPAEAALQGELQAPSPQAELQRALDLGYAYLAKRDRTVAEMRRRLDAGAVDAETAEAAIAVLVEQHYLDDARYARRFAEDRRNLDGWGCGRIEQRLRALGVDRDLVAGAVARAPEDELEAAVDVLRRRFPAGPVDRMERDRALGVLLRRGYDFELACDAVRMHARSLRAA